MTYDALASAEVVSKTKAALEQKGYKAFVVKDKAEALNKIKELIPAGVSVMNGASRTLEQIGYVDYLKAGQHGWNNLHEVILKETDLAKQAQLRKQAILSDFYLGSVHGLTQTGEMVIASNGGSQLPHIVYTSQNLILVVSTQKIMPTLDDARRRLHEYVLPLEDARLLSAYKVHTALNKEFIFHGEHPSAGRNINIILINEKLGF